MKKTIYLLLFILSLSTACEKNCLYNRDRFLGDYNITSNRMYPPSWGIADTIIMYESSVTEVEGYDDQILYGNHLFRYISCEDGEYTFELMRTDASGILKFKGKHLTYDFKDSTFGHSSHDAGVKIK